MTKGKILIIKFILLFVMVACKTEEISNENFVHWTEKTDNQLQRLDEARIKYEIRDMEIWINEKDLDKAVVCCS